MIIRIIIAAVAVVIALIAALKAMSLVRDKL
jgi:hypothetical protein